VTDMQNETVVSMSQRFAAPRERVFDAWTNPEVLRRWWAGAPTMTTPLAEVDLRPGGRYRLSMHDPDSGDTHTVSGEYREVRAPERLAYTWAWEAGPAELHGSPETLVEVDFVEDGDGTLVELRHSGFGNAQARDMHVHGWTGVLANLERKVFPA
jgi:glutathione S-transferase